VLQAGYFELRNFSLVVPAPQPDRVCSIWLVVETLGLILVKRAALELQAKN
jgi:hypothetical protein